MQLPTTTPLFLQPKPAKPTRRELTKEELDELAFAFSTLAEGAGFVSQKQLKVGV